MYNERGDTEYRIERTKDNTDYHNLYTIHYSQEVV